MFCQVFVEFPDGSAHCIEIDTQDKGRDLKRKAAEEGDVTLSYMDLYFCGEIINDNETLVHQGLSHDSEVTAAVSKMGTAMRVLREADAPLTTDALIDESRRGGSLVGSFLDAGVDPNTVGELQKITPLIAASLQGNCDTINTLVEKGACPDLATPGTGLIALVSAAGAQQTRAVKVLLQNGADVNAAASRSGYTALINAIYSGNYDIVRILRDHGADVDKPTAGGVTPIMAAVQVGNFDIIKLLMDAAADLLPVDEDGDDVFTYARDVGDSRLEMALNNNFDFDTAASTNDDVGEQDIPVPLFLPLLAAQYP
eukprot:TRINITY_DN661_c1_g1_i1.p1 TRINITY_DN661_c1_g1~~TRINITY_DN661_c1_g1_i1.p1  ORF type:complete len:313 (+),score=70.83 TRINITY_DN661_c1_g1_i1:60-998(+)